MACECWNNYFEINITEQKYKMRGWLVDVLCSKPGKKIRHTLKETFTRIGRYVQEAFSERARLDFGGILILLS